MFKVVCFFFSLWMSDLQKCFGCQPKPACGSAGLRETRLMVLVSSTRLLLENRSYMKDVFSAVLVLLQMSPVRIGGHESSRVVDTAPTRFYMRTCLRRQIKITPSRNRALQQPLSCLHGSKRVKFERSRAHSIGRNGYRDITATSEVTIKLTHKNSYIYCAGHFF